MFSHGDDKLLYIVDGYGFIFRAFYAVPNLTTKDGEPIGAVYGFFKMLISLINSSKPEYMVVALDTGKRTFRNDIYDNFIEDKVLKELFSSQDFQDSFRQVGITFEDIKQMNLDALIEKLNIDKEKLFKLCEEYHIDTLKPPKILIILMFLELTDNLKVEDYKTQYKANRKETPEELRGQFKIIRELVDAMNIKTESKIGFEADDVIGSLAKNAIKHGYKVLIVSADKDLCQLVEDDKISVYDPVKKKFLNEQGVIERFGVRADQVCDYLSIVGDHCDNVFGVNGIGPKGAVKLLQKYGHIENILIHLNELDEKTKQKFLESREVVELAYQLIKLDTNALDVDDFSKYKMSLNHNGLSQFIDKYGFKSIDVLQRNGGFLKKNTTNEREQKIQQPSLFGD